MPQTRVVQMIHFWCHNDAKILMCAGWLNWSNCGLMLAATTKPSTSPDPNKTNMGQIFCFFVEQCGTHHVTNAGRSI